jgi:TRAP-type C4-dicarboxylate transport system permease small subunit
MLTGFVYGLCLYRTDLKFSKVLLCRIIINILLNGIFGAFLWGSYAKLNYEATITYMTLISLPKNIIYLIPQSLLLYFFLRAATPLLIRKNIVPKEVITSKIA